MAAETSWHRLDMERNYVTVTLCIKGKGTATNYKSTHDETNVIHYFGISQKQ